MDDARPIDGVGQQAGIVAIVAVVGTVFVGLLVYPGVPPALSVTGQIVLLTALVLGLFVLSAAPQTGTTVGWLAVVVAPSAGVAISLMLGMSYHAVGAGFVAMILALFVVYFAQDGFLRLSRREAAVAIVILLALTSIVLAVDLSVGGVTHEFAVRDQVYVSSGTPIVAGTVTARNDFVFREPAQYPDLQACLYSGTGRSDLVYGYNKGDGPFVGTTVPAKDTATAELTVLFADNQTAGLSAYLPVELAETCPDDRIEPEIVIARADGSM